MLQEEIPCWEEVRTSEEIVFIAVKGGDIGDGPLESEVEDSEVIYKSQTESNRFILT